MIRCLPTATLLLAALTLAGACSSPHDSSPGHATGGGTSVDECDGQTETIVAGLSRTSSEGYLFELVSLIPERPIQTSSSPGNRWLVHVTDDAGAPVTDATLSITTFMPVHMHPGPRAVAIEKGNGDYQVDELFFPMPGLYDVTLSLARSTDLRQSVVLKMCLSVTSG